MTPKFFKNIEVDGEVLKFNFVRMFTVRGVVFFVGVVDKFLVTHKFRMEATEGRWFINEPLKVPEWIRAVEEQLSFAIIDRNPIP